MLFPFIVHMLSSYIFALLGMAFFTLLERKVLGYIQLRKGPNKVSVLGIPQPLADAAKLLLKEQSSPHMSNTNPFIVAPLMALTLALILWSIFPHNSPSFFVKFGTLLFLCVSSLNVYATLAAGWSSNSKYSLLGSIRSVAQTISYEVSMALILLSALILLMSFNMTSMISTSQVPIFIIMPPILIVWITSILAETNRTPFDFAEGESELVSGFNTEYSSGSFALIFMAEYMNILVMSLFTIIFFSVTLTFSSTLSDMFLTVQTMLIAFIFLWVRGSLPRMRYDRLMALTWKGFLPFALLILLIMTPLSSLIW